MAVKTAVAVQESPNGSFVLSEAELSGLVGARGRKVTESPYLSEVEECVASPVTVVSGAIKSGHVGGVKVTDVRKGAWISAQLRKAAKQLEVDPKDFTVLDRSTSVSKDYPLGFVAFYIKVKKD